MENSSADKHLELCVQDMIMQIHRTTFTETHPCLEQSVHCLFVCESVIACHGDAYPARNTALIHGLSLGL